jgi:hypothetical protein
MYSRKKRGGIERRKQCSSRVFAKAARELRHNTVGAQCTRFSAAQAQRDLSLQGGSQPNAALVTRE